MEHIKGVAVRSVNEKPSIRISKIRICDYEGCITKLSAYNKDDLFCYVHMPKEFVLARAPRKSRKQDA